MVGEGGDMEFTTEELANLHLQDKRRRDQLTGKRGTNLQSLSDKHHEMLRLHALGLSNTTIAEKMGVHKQTVTHCVNSPVAVAQRDLIRGERTVQAVDMLEKIKDILPDALTLMTNVVNKGQLEEDYKMRRLQVSTATNLFEMAGLGPIKRTDNRNLSARVTGAEIMDLVNEANMNGGGDDGFIVDDGELVN